MSTIKQTAAAKKEEAEWRARDDMRTLAAAQAIQSDKGRMTAVKQVATAEVKRLQSVISKPTTSRSVVKKAK